MVQSIREASKYPTRDVGTRVGLRGFRSPDRVIGAQVTGYAYDTHAMPQLGCAENCASLVTTTMRDRGDVVYSYIEYVGNFFLA